MSLYRSLFSRSTFVKHLSSSLVRFTFVFACSVAVTFMTSQVAAQSLDDEAHVVPRQAEKPAEQPAAAAPEPSAAGDPAAVRRQPTPTAQPPKPPSKSNSAADLLRVGAPLVMTNVDLVLVPVMIVNPLNQLVTGFQRDNFRVYEGEQEQAIRYFSSEDAPASLSVIFDVSVSMSDKIEKAREAAIDFFRISNPQDEFSLITFSDRPHLLVDFGEPIEDIERKLDYVTPKGRTALLDAIYLGMEKMRRARHFRKALLIISDGADNTSRFSAREIKELVMESDVQIYAINILPGFFKTVEELRGKRLLRQLAEATGGRAFTVSKVSELPAVAAQIGRELRNQYVLGYRLPQPVRDGKWRKIKVSVVPPEGSRQLRVYAKTGYYGPGE